MDRIKFSAVGEKERLHGVVSESHFFKTVVIFVAAQKENLC